MTEGENGSLEEKEHLALTYHRCLQVSHSVSRHSVIVYDRIHILAGRLVYTVTVQGALQK